MAQKVAIENGKQELLRFKIAQARGKLEVKLTNDSYDSAKEAYKLAQKTEEAVLAKVKDERSALVYMKAHTKTLEANLKLLEEMSKEINKWQSGFDSLLSGNIGDALGGIFGESIKKLQLSIADSVGGLFGNMLGGLTGSLVDMGLGMLNGILSSEAVSPLEGFEDLHKLSESTVNALDSLYDVQYPMLGLTRDMKNYLGIIASSFGNIENNILRSGVDFSGDAFSPYSSTGSLGLSNKDYTLEGSTLAFESASAAEIMRGQLQAEYDLIIKKVYDSFWKTKTSYFHNYEDVSSVFAKDLAEATESAFESFYAIGDAVGLSIKNLENMQIDLGQFETTGMSSEEIASQIEQRFSAELDAIAESVFAPLMQYQLGGEGMYETAIRVSTNMEQITHALGLMGIQLEESTRNLTTWLPYFGNITLTFTTHIFDLTEAMIKGAGSIDALQAGMNSYMENFFDEEERLEMTMANMRTSFDNLGYAMPETIAGFRELVEGLNLSTVAGAEAFGELMLLSDGFAEMIEAMESANDALEEQLAREKELAEAQLAFHTDVLQKITDAYLGGLSYLNSMEKAKYAESAAMRALEAGDTQSYFDNLYSQLENEKKISTSREDYMLNFEKYITELQNAEAPATLEDLEETLESILEQNAKIEEAIRMGSYQDAITTP